MFFLKLLLSCLIVAPLFLFGDLAKEERVPKQPLVRMPEWRVEIAERYPAGNPKCLCYYVDAEKGEGDRLIKKVDYYETGQLREETDFAQLEKELFADEADYENRQSKWGPGEVPHGVSIHYYATGKVKSIAFFDYGLLDGEVKTFYPKGQPEQEAVYAQDLLCGKMARYHENGEKSFEGEFKGGKPEGTHVYYYDTGEREKCIPYRDSEMHGQVIEWYPDGAEKKKSSYRAGRLHSLAHQPAVVEYDEQHNIVKMQHFAHGTAHGECITYHSNGRRSSFVCYVEGKKEGVESWFTEEGKLAGEGHYKHGMCLGKHWKNHPNGQPAYLALYDKKGALQEPILEWDEAGTKIAEYTTDSEGNYQGQFQTWHPNGQIACDYHYVDGKFDGENRETYASGHMRLHGMYQEGRKHGPFKQWYEDGTLSFQGKFVDDQLEGEFVEFYSNGTCRQKGCYQGGHLHGTLEEWYENGQKKSEVSFVEGKEDQTIRMWNSQGTLLFQGAYHLGERVGKHTIYFEDSGKPREVMHFHDGKLHGKRELYYPNHQLQLLERYKEGEIDGEAKGYYEKGAVAFVRLYNEGKQIGKQRSFFSPDEAAPQHGKPIVKEIGQYNNMGELHGEQKIFYPNQTLKTLVCYANGKMHGRKALWDEQGYLVEEAHYVHGKLDGRFFAKDQSGREIIYHYKNNKKEGPHVVFYPQVDSDEKKVKAMEAVFKNNNLHGKAMEYYPNGQQSSVAFYKDGVQEGLVQLFHKNGKLAVEMTFKEGKENGMMRQYFPKGALCREVEVVAGLKTGEEKTYFEDGKLNSIYRYKEGKLNGLSEHWNSEGVLIFEGEYCNGKQHGKFIKYYDNGKLRLKQHFVDGVLEGFKESYDEEGNVVKTFYEKGVATKRKLA